MLLMPYPYHSRKYSLNENFFSMWSPQMAYVLGFWYADGYMKHIKSYRIIFSSIDLTHLEAIKSLLGSTSPIVRYRRHGILEKTHHLCVHSKRLYLNLQVLGGTRNKSKTLTFPLVPNSFLPDFIRGYFDGDGSVHFIKYKHSKNGKIYIHIRSNFTSGSKQFLESIRNILSRKLGLYFRKVCQYGPHQFKLGYGQRDTEKLLRFMYYPKHKISLQRKAIFLKNFLRA